MAYNKGLGLVSKIKNSALPIAFAGLSTFLFSGCEDFFPPRQMGNNSSATGGPLWGNNQPSQPQQSVQNNVGAVDPLYGLGAEDLNNASTALSLGAIFSRSPLGSLIMDVLGEDTRSRAQQQTVNDAANRIANNNINRPNYNVAGIGQLNYDNSRGIAYKDGFVMFNDIPKFGPVVFLTYTFFHDDNGNNISELNEFHGVGSIRAKDVTTIVTPLADSGKFSINPLHTIVFNSSGIIVKNSKNNPDSDLHKCSCTFAPGELYPGEYTASFYHDYDNIFNMKFKVVESR